MRYSNVFLDSIGYELAPVVVTSEEIEERLSALYERLRIPLGQLEKLTGVSERRWWRKGHQLSDGAIAAAKKALATAAVPATALGAVVYAGVGRDQFEPATACRVAAEIDAPQDAAVYDISNACLGVLNGIMDIANRIELGQIRAGMVVTAETAREIVEATIDRMTENMHFDEFTYGFATMTGGSGAAAVIVSDGSFGTPGQHKLLGGAMQSAPQHYGLCQWGLRAVRDHLVTPFMATDAGAVLKHGLDLGVRTWRTFLADLGLTPEQIDKVICHQVGSAHQEAILKHIGISPEKDFQTYPYLGNMGTVSLPLTAAIAAERNFLQPGDRVGFLGIGSGLNCLMLGLEW